MEDDVIREEPFVKSFATLRVEVESTQNLRNAIDYLIRVIDAARSSEGKVTLEVTNPEFSSCIWKYSGAMSLLLESGWIETGHHQLTLTVDQETLTKLDKVLDFLVKNRMAIVPLEDWSYTNQFQSLKLDIDEGMEHDQHRAPIRARRYPNYSGLFELSKWK